MLHYIAWIRKVCSLFETVVWTSSFSIMLESHRSAEISTSTFPLDDSCSRASCSFPVTKLTRGYLVFVNASVFCRCWRYFDPLMYPSPAVSTVHRCLGNTSDLKRFLQMRYNVYIVKHKIVLHPKIITVNNTWSRSHRLLARLPSRSRVIC